MIVFSFKNFLGFISIIFLILMSGSLLSKIEPYSNLLNFIFIFIFIFNSIYLNTKIYRNNFFKYILVFILFIFFCFLVNMDLLGIKTYLWLIINILFAYYIILILDVDKISKYFIDIILFLSLTSLLGFYFPNLFNLLNSKIFFRDQLYNFFWFFGSIDNVEYRNFSIFIEPGLYQVFLSFALLLLIFKNRYKYLYIFFISWALFTTSSTSGYLILIIYICIYMISSRLYVKLFLLPVLLSFLYFFYSMVYENVNDKFFGLQKESSLQRIISTKADLNVFYDNPILGVGFGNYISEIERRGIYLDSATNTYTQILAIMGIFNFGIILYFVFIIFRNSIKNPFLIIAFLAFLILAYSSQPFILYPFLYFSIFYLIFFTDRNTIEAYHV